ncbi:MAG: hypothetical protein HRT76_04950 [Halieaceae bacterium]|nr:hypothetical protein [Halieaceae bacterium]
MSQLFTLTITPRFYETDGVGHINNVSIAGWFETAITPGNSSLTVDCQMTQQGRNTAFGRAVMVHLDRDGGGTAPMPQEMRERLSGYGKGAG